MTQKYCINCQHFSPAENDPEHRFARCTRDNRPSLVTGKINREYMHFCNILRLSPRDSACGPEGKFFEEVINV